MESNRWPAGRLIILALAITGLGLLIFLVGTATDPPVGTVVVVTSEPEWATIPPGEDPGITACRKIMDGETINQAEVQELLSRSAIHELHALADQPWRPAVLAPACDRAAAQAGVTD